MGHTFHQWAADGYAAQLRETATGRRTLEDYRGALTDPDHREYVAAIGQPADGWTDGQTAAFGRVHDLYAENLIRVMQVPLGEIPSSSADRCADRARLQQLPDCFTTLVHDRPDDDGDGIFGWSPEAAGRLPGGWAISCPLDIGHTDASRTFLHLADRGAVARWPDGSHDLWVLGFTTFTAWATWRDISFAPLLADRTPDQ